MNTPNLQRSLRAFAKRSRFRPFEIEFMSGDRLTVTHPEAVGFRGDVVVFVGPDGEHRLFDSDSVCQLVDLLTAK